MRLASTQSFCLSSTDLVVGIQTLAHYGEPATMWKSYLHVSSEACSSIDNK